MTLHLFVTLCCSVIFFALSVESTPIQDQFDDEIQSWMSRFGIESAGYAVISPDFNATKAFGSYTVDTLTMIASTSKHLAATTFAWMVKNNPNLLHWDDLVNVYPWANTTNLLQQGTFRDYLSHRTGVPGSFGETMIYNGYNLPEIEATIPSYTLNPFRPAKIDYSNGVFHLGFKAASELLGTNPEQQLDDFFQAAGMTNTFATYNSYKHSNQLGTLYDWFGAPHTFNKPMETQEVAAGGVVTTINDMYTFIKLQLEQPDWVGDLSPLKQPLALSGGPNGKWYGPGTAIYPILGTNYYGHPGLHSIGVSTSLMYNPDTRIGIFIVINAALAPPMPLTEYLIYLLNGQTAAAATTNAVAFNNAMTTIIQSSWYCFDWAPPANTVDSSALDGTYFNPIAGKIKINKGQVTFGKLLAVPFSYDGVEAGFFFYCAAGIKGAATITPVFDVDGGISKFNFHLGCGCCGPLDYVYVRT